MMPFHFSKKISALPYAKAKTIVRAAQIAIAVLFVSIMASTAITTWFLFTSPNKLFSLAVLVLLGVASFFGGRMHREVYEARIFLSSERYTFNLNIPEKTLAAIPYSPTAGIRNLAECLMEGKPFLGAVCYKELGLPNSSIAITFLNQELLDTSNQLKRINEAVNDGAKLILIAHMAEGLTPKAAKSLRAAVKQICLDYDVTVINEEYHRNNLRYYECSFDSASV